MIWSDISTEISLLANDASKQIYSEELRRLCWNKAVDYFAQDHTAPLKIVDIDCLGDGEAFNIPEDYLMLSGIVHPELGQFLEGVLIQGNALFPTTGYIELEGKIKVFSKLETGKCTLWYYAHYPSIIDNNTEITVPKFAIFAVEMLAMSILLNPQMLSEVSLDRFKSLRDRGDPTDSSMRTQADWYIKQYQAALRGIPPQQRAFYSVRR